MYLHRFSLHFVFRTIAFCKCWKSTGRFSHFFLMFNEQYTRSCSTVPRFGSYWYFTRLRGMNTSFSEIPAFMMYTRCGALTSNVNYHRSQIDRSVNIFDSYFNLNNINSATYAKVLKIYSQRIYACAGYPDQRIISP